MIVGEDLDCLAGRLARAFTSGEPVLPRAQDRQAIGASAELAPRGFVGRGGDQRERRRQRLRVDPPDACRCLALRAPDGERDGAFGESAWDFGRPVHHRLTVQLRRGATADQAQRELDRAAGHFSNRDLVSLAVRLRAL